MDEWKFTYKYNQSWKDTRQQETTREQHKILWVRNGKLLRRQGDRCWID